MLLRRIIEHVKAQNWVAVVLDLAVVVLGVFIGFQVDRWYEAARDRADERGYLQRLHADAVLSIVSTTRVNEFNERNRNLFGFALESLRSCNLPEAQRDQFATALFHLGKFSPPSYVRGTLQELHATGNLGLINDFDLLDLINEATREIEFQQQVWTNVLSRSNAQRDYMDQKYIFHFNKQPQASGNVTWAELEIDFEVLCTDQRFKSGLSMMRQQSYIVADFYGRNLTNFRKIQAALERKLQLRPDEVE